MFNIDEKVIMELRGGKMTRTRGVFTTYQDEVQTSRSQAQLELSVGRLHWVKNIQFHFIAVKAIFRGKFLTHERSYGTHLKAPIHLDP